MARRQDPPTATAHGRTPPLAARVAAAVALADFAVMLATLLAILMHDLPYLFASLLCLVVGVPLAWIAATSQRARWLLCAIAGAVGIAGLALAYRGHRSVAGLVALTGEVALMAWLGGRATRWEVSAAMAQRWTPVAAAKHPVLLMNPKSGGGKVERCNLAEEARARGIEAIVLESDDDVIKIAEDAVARGADVIGMAGGDGSQGLVASVAADHGLAFVCVPAGTRNHLALDLGVNRRDLVGALDAFGAARETCMDLATVNDRVFVNTVSLGIYAEIVQSEAYRDAKFRTVSTMLPELLGADTNPFDFRIAGPDGVPIEDVHLVQVSNGPYELERLGAFGTRPRLDAGCLGIAALRLDGAAEITAFIALEAAGRLGRFEGWRNWAAPCVEVECDGEVAVGLDGEAVTMESPLTFAIRPGALRVRIPLHHPGVSPAATRHGLGRSTFLGLARIAAGRPSGLVVAPAHEPTPRASDPAP